MGHTSFLFVPSHRSVLLRTFHYLVPFASSMRTTVGFREAYAGGKGMHLLCTCLRFFTPTISFQMCMCVHLIESSRCTCGVLRTISFLRESPFRIFDAYHRRWKGDAIDRRLYICLHLLFYIECNRPLHLRTLRKTLRCIRLYIFFFVRSKMVPVHPRCKGTNTCTKGACHGAPKVQRRWKKKMYNM